MKTLSPIDIFRVANIVGEGILWDWRRQVLWWTDIQGRQLHRFDWAPATLQAVGTPERVGSFGLIAGSERLITAFASGIALYDVDRQSVEWLPRQPALEAGVRFNDGRVDRRGRFWSGTMVEGDQDGASACLYSVDRTGDVRCQARGIRISNGLCHSPGGERLYFADSPTRTIFEYELL
jgi:L-arabinonolactonase